MKNLAAKTLLAIAMMGVRPTLASPLAVFNDPCDNCSPYTSTGSPQYYGGNGGNAAGDIVGQDNPSNPYESLFDILSMAASATGPDLVVSITTRFVEDTNVSPVLYGDLLLSTAGGWHPHGSPPYAVDNASNSGTTWNYLVYTQTGILYKNAQLKQSDTAPHDSLFRHNQYVGYASGGDVKGVAGVAITPLDAIYGNGLPNTVDGSLDASGTQLTYTIPLAYLGLQFDIPTEVGLRWTMTGANDIIEAAVIVGETALPEPPPWSLLLGGLASWHLLRSVAMARAKKPPLSVKLAVPWWA